MNVRFSLADHELLVLIRDYSGTLIPLISNVLIVYR